MDVVVNTLSSDLNLGVGAVSNALLKAAGPQLQVLVNQQATAPVNIGTVIVTAGANLKNKLVFHAVAPHYNRGKGNEQKVLENIIDKCLNQAEQRQQKSIIFSAIGTGNLGFSKHVVIGSMLDLALKFSSKRGTRSVQEVAFALHPKDAQTIQVFTDEFNKKFMIQSASTSNPTQQKIPAYVSNVKSFLTGSWEKEVKQHGGKDFVIEGIKIVPACFSICGPTPAAVDKTKTFLEDMITPDLVFHKTTDTTILSFSDKDQQRIQDMQSTLDLSIRLEYNAKKGSDDSSGEATLIVEGLSRDVLKASHEIQDMLKRAKEDEKLKKDIEYLSELVEWQYEQAGQYKSFDPRANFELEKALGGGAKDIEISIQGQDYQVKMPEGPAVSTTGGNQMNIRRIKLKATESIPLHWNPMKNTDLFKVFQLNTTDPEYNVVLKQFRATCPNNVLKIERVQNPGMWRNYQNNKSVMEIKNGHQNNEKRLFHGTSEQTINQINKSGFNRSYAGQNAAAYGRGTYFALNANYSANNTYSVPNAQGQKHMYLCRVLTGDYTKGSSAMIVPPPKNTTGDQYDTVVDNPAAPTIFVVFRDDNAYPDYIITFT